MFSGSRACFPARERVFRLASAFSGGCNAFSGPRTCFPARERVFRAANAFSGSKTRFSRVFGTSTASRPVRSRRKPPAGRHCRGFERIERQSHSRPARGPSGHPLQEGANALALRSAARRTERLHPSGWTGGHPAGSRGGWKPPSQPPGRRRSGFYCGLRFSRNAVTLSVSVTYEHRGGSLSEVFSENG